MEGLLNVKSAEQVQNEEDEANRPIPILPKYHDPLAHYIRSGFSQAKEARRQSVGNEDSIDIIFEQSQRQIDCVYDPSILSAIREMGGSEAYEPLTIQKSLATEAWLRDVLSSAEKPWGLENTPIPDLPENMLAQIEREMEEHYEKDIPQDIKESNDPKAQEYIEQKMFQDSSQRRDDVMAGQIQEAKKSCERMERYINDQLVEGRLPQALNEFVENLTRKPIAILKTGYSQTETKTVNVRNQETGAIETRVVNKKIRKFTAPRPEDVYFQAGALDIENGDLFEIARFHASEIQKLKNTNNYRAKAIDAVLEEYGRGGLREWTDRIHEQSEAISGMPFAGNSYNGEIDAVLYYGKVQGTYLKEWEIPNITNEFEFYPITAMLIGNYVVMATINPDPLGRKPYFVTSLEKKAKRIYGRSIPQKVREAQRAANIAKRALVDNLAIASGFQAVVNVSALAEGEAENIGSIYRGKIWQTTDRPSGSDNRPITFFSPNMMSAELTNVLQKFYNDADRSSGIPAYIQGDGTATKSGALGTAKGLALMLSASSKTMKQIIYNIDDDIFVPMITMLYDMNMRDPEVPENCKGDLIVRPRGASSLAVKEHLQEQRAIFLQTALGNQKIMEILGDKGLIVLLREQVKGLDLPPYAVIPSDQELESGRKEEYEQMFAQVIQLAMENQMIDEQTAQMLMNPEAVLMQQEGQNE